MGAARPLWIWALALLVNGCASTSTVHELADADAGDSAAQYQIVDCLLPPQLIRQGEHSVTMTPSRPAKLSARLCAQQGGAQKAGLDAWQQLAASGNAEAQSYLGEMYQQGVGGAPKDSAKAIEWFQKAAKQGNARALSNLALLYDRGDAGVLKDDAKARANVKQAIASTGVDVRNITVVATGQHLPVEPLPAATEDGLRRFPFGDYHALLIGNSEYQNMPKLASPVFEVDAVGKLLESKYGFQVKKLKNATKEQILKALDDMNQRLKPTDNLLVYYTGHGAQSETGQGYWIPVNGEGAQSTNKFRTRLWVSTSDVRDQLAEMSARHVLVVSDSCYSARFLQFRGQINPPAPDSLALSRYFDIFSKVYEVKSRTALTSGGLSPVLEPTDGSKMSLFAKAFVSYLDRNHDITPSVAIFAGIEREVMDNSFRIGFPQQPQWGPIDGSGHESGDFYFRPK